MAVKTCLFTSHLLFFPPKSSKHLTLRHVTNRPLACIQQSTHIISHNVCPTELLFCALPDFKMCNAQCVLVGGGEGSHVSIRKMSLTHYCQTLCSYKDTKSLLSLSELLNLIAPNQKALIKVQLLIQEEASSDDPLSFSPF